MLSYGCRFHPNVRQSFPSSFDLPQRSNTHKSSKEAGPADACNYSPAREPSVITVGAIKLGDGMARFSNGGNCINIMAPGVNIISAAHGSTTATACVPSSSKTLPCNAHVPQSSFKKFCGESCCNSILLLRMGT